MTFDDDDIAVLGYGSQWDLYAAVASEQHERQRAYDRERKALAGRTPRRAVIAMTPSERAQKRRERLGVEVARAEARVYHATYRERIRAGRLPAICVCADCGKSWVRPANLGGRKPRFCSELCRKRAGRIQRAA